MKLHTDINNDNTSCRTQNSLVLECLILELWPFEIDKKILRFDRVRLETSDARDNSVLLLTPQGMYIILNMCKISGECVTFRVFTVLAIFHRSIK